MEALYNYPMTLAILTWILMSASPFLIAGIVIYFAYKRFGKPAADNGGNVEGSNLG